METAVEARRREVWERRQAGDKFVDIARDMGISPKRVHDLYKAHLRRLDRTGYPVCWKCGRMFTLEEAQRLLQMAELHERRKAELVAKSKGG